MRYLLLLVLIIFAIGIFTVEDAFAEITISDDATGGDCATIGTWDSASRTCTFTSDVSETVVVGSNNITLDGNNHTIDSGATTYQEACNVPPATYTRGIDLEVKTNVTVKNFTIKNFCHGIEFSDSVNNSILNNVFTNNYNNIQVYTAEGTIISGNTISSTSSIKYGYGIYHSNTSQSGAPLIENNNISNTSEAIVAGYWVVVKNNILDSNNSGISVADYPQIFDNTVTNTEDTAIRFDYYGQVYHNVVSNNGKGIQTGACCTQIFENVLSNNDKGMSISSSNNYIYHNNFLSNTQEATGSGSIFENEERTSGNYWSDYSPTCTDSNADNFCDDPYPFSGGSIQVNDSYVWTIQDGWLTQITNPGDIILEAPTTSGLVQTFSVTATHDGSSMSVTCDTASGTTFPIGNSTVTCTAANGIKAAFTVAVSLDSTNPTISVPSDITVVSPDNSGLAVTYDVTASDNFAVTSGPTCTPASGSTFAVGTTTVTCTAEDAAGNVGTQTFTVTNNVEDVSPVVTVPADIILSLAQGETDSIAEFSVNATDNVAVTVGPTCSPASGSIFAIGNITVTCTAADAAGNVGTGTFVISVVEYDTTPPTVTVPSDITINEIASNVGGVATFSVTATDNVAVTVGPTCTPISGATFSVGDNTVTCTAEDANGNVGTGTFVVTVVEYVPPPISATVTNAPGSSTPGCGDTADGCFIPSPVTISVGGTVTWENNDTASHTTTSGTATGGPSGHWDSSLAMAGGSFSHTFDQDGTYHYFCMVHPWMLGSVVVGDGTPIRTAEPEPEVEPEQEPVETETEVVSPSDEITAGSEIQIETEITNQQDDQQPFAYIVQIKDEIGATISISMITGVVGQGQTITQTISWMPSESGVYVAEVYLWSDLNQPTVLSSVVTQSITVN